MDYDKIINDQEHSFWKTYTPMDVQYVRYGNNDPSIVAAGHKIEDVYYGFCNARCSFINAGRNNYGDLYGNDELSKKYAKSHFLISAVLEYSICLDLSWQVVWAYIQPSSFEYLTKSKYIEMEKECTRENIHLQLNCAISQNGSGVSKATKLKQILIDFDEDTDVIKLRSIYNLLKHQGTIHFDGLGIQLDTMSLSVNNRTIPLLSRKTFTLEEIESLLYNYHNKFKQYFNSLITEIMPENYKDSKVSFEDYINTVLQMNSTLSNE